jgi:type IX secretion system PorP/SprF family membrane protein
MKKNIIICAGLTLAFLNNAFAQEIQMNQVYGQAAMSNPALLCADGGNKVTLGYHTYYANISNPWREYSGTVEFSKDGKNNLGLGFVRSEANNKMATLNGLNLMYGYALKLSDMAYLRFGLQGGLRTKSFGNSPAVYEDMIDPYNGVKYETNESLSATQVNYFTLGAGLSFNLNDFYLSLGLQNANQPNTAYANSGGIENKEPMGIRLMTGYRIRTQGDPMKNINQIIPYIHYAKVGDFTETAAGLAIQNEVFSFGAGYHMYSYKANSVLTSIGFTSGNIKLGYNMGYNMGDQAKMGGVSHEICASLYLTKPEKKEPGKTMPLPMF